jgi:hypothetical protein
MDSCRSASCCHGWITSPGSATCASARQLTNAWAKGSCRLKHRDEDHGTFQKVHFSASTATANRAVVDMSRPLCRSAGGEDTGRNKCSSCPPRQAPTGRNTYRVLHAHGELTLGK